MSEFNFNSQVCTSKIQSERLIALGLKKETADCCYYYYDGEYLIAFAEDAKYESDIPAWSLYRLIEMMPTIIKRHQQVWTLSLNGAGVLYLRQDMVAIVEALADNLFDNIIGCIEWLIKEGYFNKEYLE